MGCTPEGALWLMQSLNPFSDWECDPVGMPDTDGNRSVIYKIPLNMTISAPPSAAGGPWDCNIFMLPLLSDTRVQQYDFSTNYGALTQQALGSVYFANFVNAIAVPAGNPTGPNTTTNLPLWDVVAPVWSRLGFDAWCFGQGRLVSAGVEAYNVTKVTELGGQVTAYRLPQSKFINSVSTQDGTLGDVWATTNTPVMQAVLWPISQASALLLTESKLWKAADGGYIIATMSETANPYMTVNSKQTVFANNTSVPGQTTGAVNVTAMAGKTRQQNVSIVGEPVNYYDGNYVGPWNSGGLYFSGLSNETQLQVVLTGFFEVAPQPTDKTVTLARQACPYDPVALELYSRAMQFLPVGDVVANNANGDWFRKLCNVLADVAEPIGNIVGAFVPGASMVGSVISRGARMATNVFPKQ
jgi:hypothetical protein